MYYITVGKRKTAVIMASAEQCYGMIAELEHKLGRTVQAGVPKLITNEFYETEKMNRADRACKILDLIS